MLPKLPDTPTSLIPTNDVARLTAVAERTATTVAQEAEAIVGIINQFVATTLKWV